VRLEPRLARALVKGTKGSGLARAPFLGARSTTKHYYVKRIADLLRQIKYL
jgi:hypothetical protein